MCPLRIPYGNYNHNTIVIVTAAISGFYNTVKYRVPRKRKQQRSTIDNIKQNTSDFRNASSTVKSTTIGFICLPLRSA